MKVFMTDMEGKEHELLATEEWTVMEIIREGGIPILAQCGGSCACATCHIYVDPSWKSKVPEPNEEEIGMLDGTFGLVHREVVRVLPECIEPQHECGFA